MGGDIKHVGNSDPMESMDIKLEITITSTNSKPTGPFRSNNAQIKWAGPMWVFF